ncbi:MAG: flippase [Parcubacteria group bacterium]
MSILRQGFGVFVTRLWGAAVGLLISIIIAREFGPEGKGVASLVLLLPTLLTTFGNAGLHISNVYFFGKRNARLSELAANSLWVGLGLGTVVFVVSLALYPIAGERFFAGVPSGYLLAVAALAPAMLVNTYFGNLLLARQRIAAFNLVNVLQLTVQFIAILTGLYLFELSIVVIVYAIAANLLLGAGLVLYLVYRRDPSGWRFNRHLLSETLRYGLKGYLANTLQFLNYRSDLLLVSYFLGVTAVGWYSVAVNFAEVLWYVPSALGTVLFPAVANVSTAQANVMTARVSRQTVLLMTLASALVALVAPWLLPRLFGSDFIPSVNALLILLPGVLIFSVAKILGNDFSGRGLVVTNSIVSGLALIANVALNIVLVPRLGINGASLASSITYSIASIVLVVLFSRVAHVPISRVVLPENEDLRDLIRAARMATHKRKAL